MAHSLHATRSCIFPSAERDCLRPVVTPTKITGVVTTHFWLCTTGALGWQRRLRSKGDAGSQGHPSLVHKLTTDFLYFTYFTEHPTLFCAAARLYRHIVERRAPYRPTHYLRAGLRYIRCVHCACSKTQFASSETSRAVSTAAPPQQPDVTVP